ncbi:MAG: hypothetical protein P8X42_12690 [Calditrichaceae bacterium]|jgi:predicted nucleic acid-binding protein
MKIMTCFIDGNAWIAITDKKNEYHEQSIAYFKTLLGNNTKLVTNNIAMDEALVWLKSNMGAEAAKAFLNTIDESILTVNLRMDWISRRVRRAGLNNFLKSKDPDLKLKHFLIHETIKRKRVDIIFTFDQKFKVFGIPLTPQSL